MYVGEVKRGKDIGYACDGKFVWQACADCSKERWVLLRFGIPIAVRCLSCAEKKKGRENRSNKASNWKGGRWRNNAGYILVYILEGDFFSTMVNKRRSVFEHRLVMAKHLGRNLQHWERVHHKNGIKDDNRIENLELTTQGSHILLHSKGYRDGFAKGYQEGYEQGKQNNKMLAGTTLGLKEKK